MIARLLISPSIESRVEEINKALVLHIGSVTLTHPDLLYFKAGEKLGIEQARKIKEHFSLKPYSASGRTVVLEDASVLTLEAQNALLKILEEPPKEALILLGAKSEADLLPTVLSRCQVVILEGVPRPIESRSYQPLRGVQDDIEKLLQSSIETRFEYIEKLKDREEFLHALVNYFREALHAPRHRLTRLEAASFLKELLQAEKWAAQNVNIRAILEYLMLVMPTGK